MTSIEVPEGLRSDATVMEVQGRQAWSFNQVIRFGDYSSSKINQGGVRGSETRIASGLELRFKDASQKLSFMVKGPQGRETEVLAASRLHSTAVARGGSVFSSTSREADTFAGAVIPRQGGGGEWEFVVFQPESSSPGPADSGSVTSGSSGRKIVIRAVKKVEGQPKYEYTTNFGFEFVMDGQTIGAVSLVSKGRVWLRRSLDPEIGQVIASVATALLVREDLH